MFHAQTLIVSFNGAMVMVLVDKSNLFSYKIVAVHYYFVHGNNIKSQTFNTMGGFV